MSSIVALSIYLIALAGITFFASRSKSSLDFLYASKNVGWKIIAVSIFASILSSFNIVVGLSLSYLFGPWMILVYGGAFLAFVVIYYLVKQQHKDKLETQKFNTVIDFLKGKFGSVNASVFNLSFVIVLLIFISLQFYVNTSIFSTMVGWDKYTSTIVVGVIVLAYIAKGGLKIEILTDLFQGFLMLFFIGMVFLVDTSNISSETILPLLKDQTIILGALSIGVSQFLTLLVQPELWQRIYSVKTLKDLKKGLFASWGLILAFIVPIITIGLSARANGIEDSNNLFYTIIQDSSPEWFVPIITVALFAAFMSSLDSSLFAVSSQIAKYGFWIDNSKYQHESDEQLVTKTRLTLVVVTLITLGASLFFSDFLTSVIQLISLLTINAVIIVASIVLKLTNKEVLTGTLFGVLTYIVAMASNMITDDPSSVLYPSLITFGFVALQRLIFIQSSRSKPE
jgi:Na+/proline symporter